MSWDPFPDDTTAFPCIADASRCHGCRYDFGLLSRRRQCRRCGLVFCVDCCAGEQQRVVYNGLSSSVTSTTELVCESCYTAIEVERKNRRYDSFRRALSPTLPQPTDNVSVQTQTESAECPAAGPSQKAQSSMAVNAPNSAAKELLVAGQRMSSLEELLMEQHIMHQQALRALELSQLESSEQVARSSYVVMWAEGFAGFSLELTSAMGMKAAIPPRSPHRHRAQFDSNCDPHSVTKQVAGAQPCIRSVHVHQMSIATQSGGTLQQEEASAQTDSEPAAEMLGSLRNTISDEESRRLFLEGDQLAGLVRLMGLLVTELRGDIQRVCHEHVKMEAAYRARIKELEEEVCHLKARLESYYVKRHYDVSGIGSPKGQMFGSLRRTASLSQSSLLRSAARKAQ